MARKLASKPVDCIMGLRGHVVESAPVIWYEIPRLQPVEKRKRIIRRKVAFPERVQLPPGRVSYRQEREVESPPVRDDMLIDHPRGVRHQSRVAGKELRYRISSEQIHIRCASPPVDAVPVPLVCGFSCTNGDIAGCYTLARADGCGRSVT